MGKASSDLNFEVDKEHWGMVFDPVKEEHLTERIINGYITHMMIYYTATNYEDKDLWYTFCEDFKGIIINILNITQ
jgi:hypothetical protein